VKLSILDRITLLSVLPHTPRGKKLAFYREVQALMAQLAIGDLEKQAINFRTEGDSLRWEPCEDVEFEISEAMRENIAACFAACDEKGTLGLDCVATADKFAKVEVAEAAASGS
jgi:hypothetical protein